MMIIFLSSLLDLHLRSYEDIPSFFDTFNFV